MVAASPADGYTVLVGENAIGINQALFKKHPSGFNPLKDYDAVGAMASVPVVWTVANNVPANNFPDFVKWSKTVPGHFNYGHAGPGSVSHLIPEVILDATGMQAGPVPFKGGGPAAQAVAGGFVSVVVSSLAVAKPLIEGKLVKGLLVTSPKRSPALPDVPTLKELNLKTADVDLEFWWGLFVPKGTPEPIRAKIEKALQTTMMNPAVRARLAKVDTDPSFAPGPALRVKLEKEITNWSKFIDAKGIKVEQ
jgi:tripartite-type tricarboxylate transporter receptor subunit TctC